MITQYCSSLLHKHPWLCIFCLYFLDKDWLVLWIVWNQPEVTFWLSNLHKWGRIQTLCILGYQHGNPQRVLATLFSSSIISLTKNDWKLPSVLYLLEKLIIVSSVNITLVKFILVLHDILVCFELFLLILYLLFSAFTDKDLTNNFA